MVALQDGLHIQTPVGTMKNRLLTNERKKPRTVYLEKLTNSVGEALGITRLIYQSDTKIYLLTNYTTLSYNDET